MASVATTISDASITLAPELIGEATSLKQLQGLLKSVLSMIITHTSQAAAVCHVSRQMEQHDRKLEELDH
ncbi:hypothetical protein ABBQ38_000749 [Trebouxia sp. C0009 RCD-2024]